LQGSANTHQHSFKQLRFSSNGQWILAQDEQTIRVLEAADLHLRFVIPAASANLAAFTPDSKQLFFVDGVNRRWAQQVIYNPGVAHLERWDLLSARRVGVTELAWNGCTSASMSPDGSMLGCVSEAEQFTVIDTATLKVRLNKKVSSGSSTAGRIGYVDVRFSPDSRYVLLTKRHGSGAAEAYDLLNGKRIELNGALRDLRHARAMFISPSMVAIALEAHRGSKQNITELVTFPEGGVVASQDTPFGNLSPAADPHYLLIHPGANDWDLTDAGTEVVAVDVRTGYAILSDSPGLDVLADRYVAESGGGIALFEHGPKLIASVRAESLALQTN
jgi:hypothetical protein